MESLLLLRLTPPVAPVRERRAVTAQAGGAFINSHFSLIGIEKCIHGPPPSQLPDANMLSEKNKADLRRAGKAARRKLTHEVRGEASENICAAAIQSTSFENAKLIACYLATDNEVNCRRLIERAWHMKKRIFLPIVQKHSKLKFVEFFKNSRTRTNTYGIEEPVGENEIDPRELDLVFTPLVAFDSQGNRVGMGGGYYDRTFSFLNKHQHNSGPMLVGLAFDCQYVEQIGASAWDIRLFRVITESDTAA